MLTICVDFDNTIRDMDTNAPIPGAAFAIKRMRNRFKVVVLTANNVRFVSMWLAQHRIDVDDVTNTKPPALAYIDDRAIKFEDWPSTLATLKRLPMPH